MGAEGGSNRGFVGGGEAKQGPVHKVDQEFVVGVVMVSQTVDDVVLYSLHGRWVQGGGSDENDKAPLVTGKAFDKTRF